MKYTPRRHQKIAYDFCMSRERAGLFIGMGLGKTVVSLTVFNDLKWDRFTVRKALVVAPLNVARTVWMQECWKWDHLKHIRSVRVMGTPKQRIKALNTDVDLYIINRENLVWLIEYYDNKLPFDLIILDELSSFKNANTKRWKALKKAIHPIRYRYGLTGTPAPNGYLDLWPQIYLLDEGERLGKRIGDYRSRYFTAGAHKGHIVYEWRLRIGAKDAINRKLQDLCLSMKSEDWLDLPPILYNDIYVEMDSKGRATYDKFKADKVLPLLKGDAEILQLDPRDPEQLSKMNALIAGDTAATVRGKLLQMANGAVYDDQHGVIPIHDAKLDALEELVEFNEGENLLVFYSYQHDKDRILKRFPNARCFAGPQDAEDWNAGKIPMLLCHPASTGHGLNLQQGGHIIVWFGLTWSLELYQQANARLQRTGQKESVIVHRILCKDTYDEGVADVLQDKEAEQSSLLLALKKYLEKENI